MNILMVIPSLPIGGAEWAFVRLANALAGEHQVTAYVPYRCDSSSTLLKALKGVSIISLPLPHAWFHSLLYKVSELLKRVRPSFDLEQRLHSSVLRSLHNLRHFDLVNPHLRSACLIVCKAFENLPIPIIEHDHGDYALLKKMDPQALNHQLLMQRVDSVICPSRHNTEVVRDFPWHLDFQCTVIPYSMPAALTAAPRTNPQFTFGMVARGIEEKGWAEAIAAFQLTRDRCGKPMRLVLVGGSNYLDKLKSTYANDESIVFAGTQDRPADWISGFDVGLLPSYFAAESLPCSVIEYLTLGKPVIATDAGGIPDMLESEDGNCGIIVRRASKTGKADINTLAQAMATLAMDDSLRDTMATRASRASLRYDDASCAKACADYFRRTIARQHFAVAPASTTGNLHKVV